MQKKCRNYAKKMQKYAMIGKKNPKIQENYAKKAKKYADKYAEICNNWI